jgi:uncharacterized membrane protein
MADAPPAPPVSLAELRKNRKPIRNVVKEHTDSLSPLDKLACFITDHVGTMGFFLLILVWTVFWLSWNLLAPVKLRFDPGMAFVFYLFISNVIQILLMPLIMVGQNVQGKQSDRRAQSDLEINIKAEKEVETILQHLEYQNGLLLDLLKRVDTSVSTAIKKREADTTATKIAIQKLADKTGAAVEQAKAAKAAVSAKASPVKAVPAKAAAKAAAKPAAQAPAKAAPAAKPKPKTTKR